MSLWCGSCRTEIFEGFSLLFLLERASGELQLSDKEGETLPNSAVCDNCLTNLSKSDMLTDEDAKKEAERSTDPVYALVPADSDNDRFWGSKTWSGIVADETKLALLKPGVAERLFPKAILIIEEMAGQTRSG